MADRKAAALVLVLVVVVVFLTLAAPLLSRSVSNGQITKRFTKSSQAFWLAEAGVNRAFNEFKIRNVTYDMDYYQIYGPGTNILYGTLSQGSYSVDLGPITPISTLEDQRIVTSHGYAPVAGGQIQRSIEVVIRRTQENIFEEIDVDGAAIYCAGDVDLNGNAYLVEGSVIYAGELDAEHDNVTGETTNDPSISPLVTLAFDALKSMSQDQGNFFDAERLKLVGKTDPNDPLNTVAFPESFWNNEHYDGVDNDGDGQSDEPDEGINIVYVEGDLPLNGNVAIGGFIIVAGDIYTDPVDTDDVFINGTGTVDGVIYTRGVFRVNGGGGPEALNVYGGVLCGELGRLNGNVDIAYNAEYMGALDDLEITKTNYSYDSVSWKETQNPYPLDPIIGGGES